MVPLKAVAPVRIRSGLPQRCLRTCPCQPRLEREVKLTSEPVVRAGGGIVWRHGEGGAVEVVLIHRPAYGDWSFPKGKLHRGETEAEAALREVQEETGLRCRLGREVGTSAYRDPRRRPKTVRYWEMTPTGGTLRPANEVDDARWVPLDEARTALTYDRDRRILDGFRSSG